MHRRRAPYGQSARDSPYHGRVGSRRHLIVACLGAALAAPWGREPAAAGDAAGPLVPEHAVLDYGVVGQDQEHTRTLALRNAGAQPLHDLGLRTDCGCYTASLSARTLAPGAEATLSVAFRTLTFSGPVTKSVVVGYRVEGGAEHTLRVGLSLKVLGGVLAHPGRLHLGDVREGETPGGRVRVGWYDGVGRPFQIRGVEAGAAPIDVTWAPWQGTEDPRWRGFELAVRLRSPPPRGPYFAELVVLTSDPDRPRLVIPVTALVSAMANCRITKAPRSRPPRMPLRTSPFSTLAG